MATGDDANAAGMATMTGTEQADTLDTEINLTRDYIAQRTNAVQPISKGGTGATTAAAARSALGAAPTSHTHDDRYYTEAQSDGRYLRTSGGTVTGNLAVNGAWSNNITSTRRAVWMESDGTLGHTASSERYKQNVQPWDGLSDEQFAALQVVTYQWRTEYADPAHPAAVEVGVIAETLHDLGMGWAVFYDDEGRPEGVHYDRITLAVIPYVQRKLEAVEARLDGLEAS